jgi:hypothetical protein
MNPDNSGEQAGLLSNISDYIEEVHGSNFGRDTDYPDDFPLSLLVSAGLVPLIRPRPFPSASLPVSVIHSTLYRPSYHDRR